MFQKVINIRKQIINIVNKATNLEKQRIENNNKKVIIVLPIFITTLLTLFYLFIPESSFSETSTKQTSASYQEGIAKEIIRFHVIANSDTKEDQALKIKVKNAIVDGLEEPLQKTNNIEEAREVIQGEISLVTNIAKSIINEEGYQYSVSANLEETYFPTKVYGDITFPPGNYEALRVEIGEAEGKNWWCVMFPPLCFVDGTYSVVPEKSKDKLKYVLTDEEYNSLAKEGKIKVKAKFKLKEWLDELLEKE